MVKCSTCGLENPGGSNFCTNCGTVLPESSPDAVETAQQRTVSAPPGQKESASSKAVTALILGLVGFFMCGPLASIPGMIVGKSEMNAIDRGESPVAGKTMAQIGFWVSVGTTVLWGLFIVFYILVIVFAFSGAFS